MHRLSSIFYVLARRFVYMFVTEAEASVLGTKDENTTNCP
jgi:hypothetical protein